MMRRPSRAITPAVRRATRAVGQRTERGERVLARGGPVELGHREELPDLRSGALQPPELSSELLGQRNGACLPPPARSLAAARLAMRCPQPLDRRPAADPAGRRSRTAPDGPGEEANSPALPRNSSPQRQARTCAGSLVSTKSISSRTKRSGSWRCENWPASSRLPGTSRRPPVPRSDPFRRLLPFDRDLDRELINQRGTAHRAALCSQGARPTPSSRV